MTLCVQVQQNKKTGCWSCKGSLLLNHYKIINRFFDGWKWKKTVFDAKNVYDLALTKNMTLCVQVQQDIKPVADVAKVFCF